MSSADWSRRARSSRHARASSASTSTNPGRPHREVGGKYVPPKNGLAIRRQPHAHRPAARAGRRLHERHVHAVDVRPFFAIDLDRDEIAIEHGGDGGVLERLVRHHVAPVARRVANREEDRLVLAGGRGKRLVAPREPVHRVVGVLQQIRTALAREKIRHESARSSALSLAYAARHFHAVEQDDRGEIHPHQKRDDRRDGSVDAESREIPDVPGEPHEREAPQQARQDRAEPDVAQPDVHVRGEVVDEADDDDEEQRRQTAVDEAGESKERRPLLHDAGKPAGLRHLEEAAEDQGRQQQHRRRPSA